VRRRAGGKPERTFEQFYSLVTNRLLRLFHAHSTPMAECRVLFGSYGMWLAHLETTEQKGVCPREAAGRRCTRVAELGKALLETIGEAGLPSDFPLIVGYYVDRHLPLFTAGEHIDTIHAVYRSQLAPEQAAVAPVAIGHPFGSKACRAEDINRAWFGNGKGGGEEAAALYKLLSKGVASAFSNRYIGQQSERCLSMGGRPAEVVFDMVAAVRLGALAHRRWEEVDWCPVSRAAVYADRTVEGSRRFLRGLTAKALQTMVSEYVVGCTALLPAVWRAANCMVGGHAFTQSVVARRPHPAVANARAAKGSSATARKQRAARIPGKIPTRLLMAYGPAEVRDVLLEKMPAAVAPEDAELMRVLSSSLRSANYVVTLPRNTKDIQRAAVLRRTGQPHSTMFYCEACTLAHVKIPGFGQLSKRRYGVISRLDSATGTIEAYQCATCLVKQRLVQIDLVGVQLHARLNIGSAPVAITICGECGSPCANATFVGDAASCASCNKAGSYTLGQGAVQKPHRSLARCLCRSAADVRGPTVSVRTLRGDVKHVSLCDRHYRAVCKLPAVAIYPLSAVAHVIESNKPRRFKKRYVYLRR